MSTLKKPRYTLFAGSNGSGKSTLREGLAKRGVQFGEIIDLDARAKEIGYKRAAEELGKRMKILLSTGVSFTQEMATPSFVLKEAKEKGFETVLFFWHWMMRKCVLIE